MQNGESNCKLLNAKLRRASFSPPTSFHLVLWHLSPPRLVELNLNGSLINSSAAGGFIPHDWISGVLKVGSTHYGAIMILIVEARALWGWFICSNPSGLPSINHRRACKLLLIICSDMQIWQQTGYSNLGIILLVLSSNLSFLLVLRSIAAENAIRLAYYCEKSHQIVVYVPLPLYWKKKIQLN